jgi:hypothetical protein
VGTDVVQAQLDMLTFSVHLRGRWEGLSQQVRVNSSAEHNTSLVMLTGDFSSPSCLLAEVLMRSKMPKRLEVF